jgi:uncharacterized protein (UPF0548 family)
MDWIVRWAGGKPDLVRWVARDFSLGVGEGPHPGDCRDAHERVVAREQLGPPQPGGVFDRLAQAIFAFDIFPPGSVTALPERRPLRTGDTVVLQYHFLPGMDLVFGARVTDTFDAESAGTWRRGFTYRTLQGHPFCGEETFSVEKDTATGGILVALRSWSRPAVWQAWVGRPLVRRIQLRAGLGALDHLGALATPAPPAHLPIVQRRNLRTKLLRAGGDW